MFEIAAIASLAGLAMDAGSRLLGAHGEAEALEFKAQQEQRRAELGKLRAVQTDAQMLEELNTVLGNIDAVRAAANIDPTSPTTAALKAEEARISDRARSIKVHSILAQAAEDEAAARYHEDLSPWLRLGGALSAGSSIAKGLSSLPLGGGGGVRSTFDPTKAGSLY